VLGWGVTKPKSKKSQILQYLEIPVVSHKTCAARNDRLHKVNKFSNVCAGKVDGQSTHSVCHGDGGGSFACKDKTGNWRLQGIISWGDNHCGIKYYSVMTRVSSFIEWIHYKMTSPPLMKRKSINYHGQELLDFIDVISGLVRNFNFTDGQTLSLFLC